MTEATHRHGLPLLQAGQAQKEVTHNEALMLLDLLAHPAVEDVAASAPEAAQAGEMWIVGAGATGAWAGRDGALALKTEGGWRFAAAREGMTAWHKAAATFAWFDGTDWRTDGWPIAGGQGAGGQGAGDQGAGMAAGGAMRAGGGAATPAGDAAVDGEARAAIGRIQAVLRAHGLIAT